MRTLRSCKVRNNQPNKKATLQSILGTQQMHGSVVLCRWWVWYFTPTLRYLYHLSEDTEQVSLKVELEMPLRVRTTASLGFR